MSSYNECQKSRRDFIKIVMEKFEGYCKTYSIHPNDHKEFRNLLRILSFRMENSWLRYMAVQLDDKKFLNRVNEKIENEDINQ